VANVDYYIMKAILELRSSIQRSMADNSCGAMKLNSTPSGRIRTSGFS